MKSRYDISLNRLESWLETVRDDKGYHGPAIGPRSTQMGFCLQGFQIINAQINNGTFKNSHFTEGPFEGGMPHEPSMLNAAVSAAIYLENKTSFDSRPLENCLINYIDKYLLTYLWNKLLRTFNNWPFSDFESYSPASVSAVIELLWNYGTWKKRLVEFTPYIVEAGESLLRAQCTKGLSKGALSSHYPNSKGFSPFLTARCLKALQICGAMSGDRRFCTSVNAGRDYILKNQLPDGGFTRITYNDHSDKKNPLMLGYISGILFELKKIGYHDKDLFSKNLSLLMHHQSITGAFHTAIGFGGKKTFRDNHVPDYRDIFPVCAWNDKTFSILASLSRAPYSFSSLGVCERAVKINNKSGTFIENSREIILLNSKNDEVYHWIKKQDWPFKAAL
jgi:hypothetical protein